MNNASRANLPDSSKGKAVDQAALAVGVSGRTVQDAEYIRTAAPVIFEEVKAGTRSRYNGAANLAGRLNRWQLLIGHAVSLAASPTNPETIAECAGRGYRGTPLL